MHKYILIIFIMLSFNAYPQSDTTIDITDELKKIIKEKKDIKQHINDKKILEDKKNIINWDILLLNAISYNDISSDIEYLIENGADVNYTTKKGDTVLMWACGEIDIDNTSDKILKNRKSVIEILLKKGANLNSQSKSNGYTPIMFAIENKNFPLDLIIPLINGSDVNILNNQKENYINVAVRNQRNDLIEYYINNIKKK